MPSLRFSARQLSSFSSQQRTTLDVLAKRRERVYSERITNFDEFDYVNPALSTLDLRYEGLRIAEAFGQPKLSEACPLPQVAEQRQ